MKRFHVHVAVDNLPQSIRFYSTLFAAEPSIVKQDYAKWMLDDPRVNFAISVSGSSQIGAADSSERRQAGISHLGIQVESETELAEVYDRLSRAERPVIEEKNTACCYARSDKQWTADPAGVAWETFLTHEQITVYGTSHAISDLAAAAGDLTTCACRPAETPKVEDIKTAACCA